MQPRSTGKKIAFGFCVASFAGMAASLPLFLYLLFARGLGDVLAASAMATTLFFMFCGIVLYFMSKPPLYELQPWDSEEKAEK
ncbi:MAG: hypothetical protein PHX38_04015 [Sulfuricella sp.]|nr:hypothetical protein [Sulfuricella sp.]